MFGDPTLQSAKDGYGIVQELIRKLESNLEV